MILEFNQLSVIEFEFNSSISCLNFGLLVFGAGLVFCFTGIFVQFEILMNTHEFFRSFQEMMSRISDEI